MKPVTNFCKHDALAITCPECTDLSPIDIPATLDAIREQKPMTKAEEKRQRIAEAVARIKRYVTPGTTVYTNIVSTSRTNMSAQARVYVVHDGKIVNLTASLAIATNRPIKRGWIDSLRLDGLGTDRSHVIAYSAANVAGIDPYSLSAAYL
jgi:hypothetical protein